ncbi:MAG: flagellin lysine-N-methylase [Clostridia bacterium]|nr:flagellin lysine-N-methylase [Clostridia bacterium]
MAFKQYPNYYTDFSCIAGECTETCCAGWEVDLDEEALFYYQNIAPAPFGDVIRSHIAETPDGGYCFPLRENGRCPFLNDDNLCDIIINLGETRICRTCTEHPRFVVEVDDFTQLDLSLSCPEAARLFFDDDLEFSVVTETFEDEFELDDAESYEDNEEFMECLNLQRDSLKILGDRSLSLTERIENLGAIPHDTDEELLNLLTCMDKLDGRWEADMELMNRHVKAIGADGDRFIEENRAFLEKNFEKISMYLAFRYFPDAYYDGDPQYGLNMIVRSLHLIYLLTFSRWREKGELTLTEFKDICHSYSKEVEHDENNIRALKGLS